MRAVRVTYQDYKSTFLELLQKELYNNTSTEFKSSFLATDIFKAKKDLSREIMMEVFESKRAFL